MSEQEGQGPTNVRSLEEEKKKRAGKRSAPSDGPSRLDIERAFVRVMQTGANPDWAFAFPIKIHQTADREGIPTTLIEDPGQVLRIIDNDYVIGVLLDYSRYTLNPHLGTAFVLTEPQAKAIFRVWQSQTPRLNEKEIAPVRLLSEPGYCWHRLPFDPAPGATPHFDELMARASNSRALKAFIGSLLEKDADRQQYVWLWGHGSNGKGSLTRFLKSVLGPSYRAELPPSRDNRFWTYGLIGARLTCFSDLDRKDEDFVTTGLFKSLTGGDPVRVEKKGGSSWTVEMHSKYLFASNSRPKISSNVADQRRAIYCALANLPSGTVVRQDYGQLLEAEGPAFLWACREIYREDCPDHGPIPCEMSEAEEIAANNEADLQDAFDKYLAPGHRDDKLPVEKQPHVSGAFLTAMFEQLDWKRWQQTRFYEWVEQRYGAVRKKPHGKARALVGVLPSKWALAEFATHCASAGNGKCEGSAPPF